MMQNLRLYIHGFCVIALLAMGLAFTPSPVLAGTPAKPSKQAAADPDSCTTFATRATTSLGSAAPAPGILTEIYSFLRKTINTATMNLFNSFVNDSGYKMAVFGAMSLMITFYGVGFLMGIVQPSFQQVLIRLVKIGILFTLISPGRYGGWQFFSDYVVTFFQDGSDQLINGIQAIGFGIPAPPNSSPFYALDRVATFLINPDTIIALLGAIGAGGAYGLAMGGIMMLAMFGFFKLILKTLEVYAVTFVARSLVLGVAPIFFVFLLFDRTKQMFIAWVNALLNLSLQPILMFTFLSFFLVMIETSAKDMLGTELCWHEFKNLDSSTNKMAFWKFVDEDGDTMTGEMDWNGALECTIKKTQTPGKKCPVFPVNIVDILSFLILVYLATKFAEVTKTIASELSNALVNLDNTGKLEQIISKNNQSAGSKLSAAPFNPNAGGATPSNALQTKPRN